MLDRETSRGRKVCFDCFYYCCYGCGWVRRYVLSLRLTVTVLVPLLMKPSTSSSTSFVCSMYFLLVRYLYFIISSRVRAQARYSTLHNSASICNTSSFSSRAHKCTSTSIASPLHNDIFLHIARVAKQVTKRTSPDPGLPFRGPVKLLSGPSETSLLHQCTSFILCRSLPNY